MAKPVPDTEISVENIIDLQEIKKLKKKSNGFIIIEIINYLSILIIYKLIKATKYKSKNEDQISNGLYDSLKDSRNRLSQNLKYLLSLKINLKRSKDIFNKYQEYYKKIQPFEERTLELLNFIIILITSPLFTEKLQDIISRDDSDRGLLYFKEILNEFTYWDFEITKNEEKPYNRRRFYYKDYSLEENHELDFKIFHAQIKNQLDLIDGIFEYHKEIEMINEDINKLREEIGFLDENWELLLNNVYLKYLSEEIKKKSPKIFNKSIFYAIIDKKGFPRLQYYESKKTAPILILSNGEKNKLFLAIHGTMMSLSTRSQFLLIDEPNEFLDPENIDIMKKYFTSIFKNRQLIICTFIDKYKRFHPALRWEVLKGPDNISTIKRLSI